MEKLRVGVSPVELFVIKKENGYTGFEIELWEIIAQRLQLEYEYVEYKFKDMLTALEKGNVDIAFGAVSVLSHREKVLDFSHATFNSGLHILVLNTRSFGWKKSIKAFFRKSLLQVLLLLTVFAFISGNIIWFVEKDGPGPLSNDKYLSGVFNGIWWAISTVSTIGYGDYIPATILGRIFGILIIFTGLALFGLYIAQITSSITLNNIRSNISNKKDLENKKVATKTGTANVEVLKELKADVVETDEISDAYEELLSEKVDAVVFDSPVLLYYANNVGYGKVTIVGSIFKKNDYAVAVRQGNDITELINRELLNLRENDEYEVLYKKWFGEE